MRRFIIKDYKAPRQARTPAQEAQHERAFRIFRLRGLYCLTFILSRNRGRVVRHVIDDELQMLGAERQADREARERAVAEFQRARTQFQAWLDERLRDGSGADAQ